MNTFHSILFGALVTVSVTSTAVATTLSPAQFGASVTMTGTHYTLGSASPIIYADDVQLPGSQSVFSLVQTGGTAPMIDLSTDANAFSVSGNPEFRSATVDVSSNLVYSMSIDGPTDTIIPMLVTTQIDISGSALSSLNNSWAEGSGSVTIFGVANWNTSSYWNHTCQLGTNCTQDGGSSVSDQQLFYFTTNTEYLISMVADASVFAGTLATSGPLSAHTDVQVVVDPVFQFYDPNDAALFTLNFSANLATVPLPAAAWLFASALGVFGYLGKRKAAV